MTWRVGLLIPSPNSVMEVDFYRSLPHDTTLHTARMYMPDLTAASEERMLEQFAMPAATMVSTVLPHIVVFGSTSACCLRGKDYDREICERVGELTGAEPISVVDSVNQALRDTRATRVAVVTPYTDEVNRRIKAGIESEGLAVSAMHGMGLSPASSATVTPESIYSFVQARIGTRVPGEALFLASHRLSRDERVVAAEDRLRRAHRHKQPRGPASRQAEAARIAGTREWRRPPREGPRRRDQRRVQGD